MLLAGDVGCYVCMLFLFYGYGDPEILPFSPARRLADFFFVGETLTKTWTDFGHFFPPPPPAWTVFIP